MKKSLMTFISAISLIALIMYNCTKSSDSTTVSTTTVSGTVTYNTTSNATGAIVVLSNDKMAASVITRVIADSTGKFVIAGLTAGTYYLSAKYITGNTNLKDAGTGAGMTFVTDSAIMVTANGTKIMQNINMSNITGGTAQIVWSTLSKQWALDQVHSRIGFSFPYDSVQANFYGFFSNWGFNSFSFNQANLAASSFNAWVDITSGNTGAPTTVIDNNQPATDTMIGGRDGIDGCMAKSEFQVKPTFADTFPHTFVNKLGHDTTVKYIYNPAASILLTPATTVDGGLIPSAKATFVCAAGGITAYGDGYVAAGQFTFHGVTKTVNLYFHYIQSPSKLTEVSFSGYFDFNPSVNYAMPRSSHVADNPVDVNVNLVFDQNP